MLDDRDPNIIRHPEFVRNSLNRYREGGMCSTLWKTRLAMDIIGHSMGRDFLVNNFNAIFSGESREGKPNRRNDYFKRFDDVDTTRFAMNLWETKDHPGWCELVKSKRRCNARALNAELFVARGLKKYSTSVEFIQRSGERGRDFDLKCVGHVEFGNINVEVKNRGKKFRTSNKVKQYFNNYVDQLGTVGKKAFIIYIDDESFLPKDQAPLCSGIREFLSKNHQVEFVVYFLTTVIELTDGRRAETVIYEGYNQKGERPKVMLGFEITRPSFYDEIDAITRTLSEIDKKT